MHFHCDQELGDALHLRAAADAQGGVQKACWLDVNADRDFRYANLYASHRAMADRVAAGMLGSRDPKIDPLKLATDYPSRTRPENVFEGPPDRHTDGGLVKMMTRDKRRTMIPSKEGRISSPWSVDVEDYSPEEYDGSGSLKKSKVGFGADVEGGAGETSAQPIDERDMARCLTYEGPVVFGPGKAPLNPRGRTGLRGTGELKHFGPSHTITVMLTRDHPVTQELQLVLVQPSIAGLPDRHESADRRRSSRRQSSFGALLSARTSGGSSNTTPRDADSSTNTTPRDAVEMTEREYSETWRLPTSPILKE